MPVLDIIIPHWNEKPKLLSYLLNSIEMQISIDFSKIQVTIVNDHSDLYSEIQDFINNANYSYNINLLQTPVNSGPGVTRQYGIDHTSSPCIMFCDADDRLYDCNVLYNILFLIEGFEEDKEWSCIWTPWNEELVQIKYSTNMLYHDDLNAVWLHGKIFNRAFLKQYDIKFHPTLRVCEDNYFCKLVLGLSTPEQVIPLNIPSYLWKKRNDSITVITREKQHSIAFTYYKEYIADVYDCLEVLKTKEKDCFNFNTVVLGACFTLYFMTQLEEIWKETNGTKLLELENAFTQIIQNFGDYLKVFNSEERCLHYAADRLINMKFMGFSIEQVDWNTFLHYIDVKYNINSYDLLKIVDEKIAKI